MAKQRGPSFIEGTYDGRTYYKMDGKYYSRKKSSLSARRVKRTPAFRRTMEYAGWMAAASVIASRIYWKLPEKERKRQRYQALTGEAMRLLRDGIDEVTVRDRMEAAYVRKEPASQVSVPPVAFETTLQPVACEPVLQPLAGDGDARQVTSDAVPEPAQNLSTASTAGQQPNIRPLKGRSIAVIPSPAAHTRRPRVLRYKSGQQSLRNTAATGRRKHPYKHDQRIQNNAYIE